MTIVQITHNPIATIRQQYYRNWEVSSYHHRISASVGFDTCSFDLQASKEELEDFFYNGLGRQVTRYSRGGNFTCWQGQIMEMTLTEPGVQFRISLREMFNRISVRYIPIDTAANPPTESAETSTAVVNDTPSQGMYGIKQTVVRPAFIDRMTAADAAQLGNVLLQQYRQPRRSAQLSSGDAEPKLSVQCEGYMHTLGWVVYNYTAGSGTANNETEIATILATSPVSQYISSTDTSSTTGLTVQQYYNRDDTALNIIFQIAALGDTGNNRWLCDMYENRRVVFHGAYDINANAVDYYRKVSDARQEIRDLSGRVIPGWEVRPNNWLKTEDVYGWKPTPLTLPDDYQSMYVEAVNWSEPDSLSLEGSTGDNLQVLMARMAYRGDRLA